MNACPDCGAGVAEAHEPGCDVERCTVCGGQKIGCSHAGHDRQAAAWTGLWPGVAECRERGWYARMVDGLGWVPCAVDEPGATEDLNRLAAFRAYGVDLVDDDEEAR